jgi:outer membrane translocation and assembly module TamA
MGIGIGIGFGIGIGPWRGEIARALERPGVGEELRRAPAGPSPLA